MKRILGLDLGTNSNGAAVVKVEDNSPAVIEKLVSRVIPMDAATLSDFGKGNTVSQTAERTDYRSVRRLRERHLLRRERLHRALAILGFLPNHYANALDEFGHFKEDGEPKLAWNEGEFLFKESYGEMLDDFKKFQPQIFSKEDSKVPYDWTIYYLRKKALTQRIEKEELAWILLNFNQKRGYYQLRGEDEKKTDNKLEEYYSLRVVSVEATDQKKGNDIWYKVHLENGWIYNRASSTPLEWTGKIKEFIVTTQIAADGTPAKDKNGEVKRSFRAPKEDDWALLKVRAERDITSSGKSVGAYIYDTLLQKPEQKIRGALIRVVERDFYETELRKILEKQTEYHPQLTDETLYTSVIEDLYRSNSDYRNSIDGRDFVYLFTDDIIFYQRPLKTKKSLISDCKYEYYTNGDTTYRLKAISKSHPLYQEFRLWKFISQLKILRKEVDVTSQFLASEEDYVALFEWLNGLSEIDNATFVKYKKFGIPKAEQPLYRWNYVIEGKKCYPCNETSTAINKRLKKHSLPLIDNRDTEIALWHILYSVKDKKEIVSALKKFARKNGYDPEIFAAALKGCIFENDYGTYSEKAVKKLLALIRRGKYWSEEAIDSRTRERINNIIGGVADESIDEKTRERCDGLKNIKDFSGMEEWLASYLIYGRHSESATAYKWEKPEDIDTYLKEFRQHSLNNPIVELVVMETLRVVRDLWRECGKFDEIHIELAREMKKTKDEREREMRTINENENTNYRIRQLLEEFQNEQYDIEEVRAYSPYHQNIFKIYEEFATTQRELPEDIILIRDKFKERDAKKKPTKGDILRYKLWLEQQYISPYTGEIIPLGKLFTTAYEIEHVIPQALYTDNSLSNKVICEAEVNKLKGKSLGMEFIKNNPGRIVTLGGGKVLTIFSEAAYREHIEKYYAKNARKAKNLLAEEVPQGFTSSQLNNTRYITRLISGLMSNIVREEGEMEAVSKNVIITSGGITDALKRDWGLNDVWNDIVYPRFERLNVMLETNEFGEWVCEDGKRFFRTRVPLELSKGFSKKRIDHRHHAMDAVVIACATRSHINYLNNISAKENEEDINRYQLRSNLCYKHKINANGDYKWLFVKPWNTFTQDVREALQDLVVSFKQNLRVINKATNNYQCYIDGKKDTKKQQGTNWAIRKSMHKDTVYGAVNLRFSKYVQIPEAIKRVNFIVDKQVKSEIKQFLNIGLDAKKISAKLKEKEVSKIEIYCFSDDTSAPLSASRKNIGDDFDVKKIASITDSGIRKIMEAHLAKYDNNPAIAFSVDGIELMNNNLVELNGGKPHKPIYKVRIYERVGNKFMVGEKGNKSAKFVEADKGTNLFFAIYENPQTNELDYESIPLNIVIERQKNFLPSVPQYNEKGLQLKYYLSPNDLVYVPTPEQVGRHLSLSEIDRQRIYKMVSCTDNECHFIPHYIAQRIIDTKELGSNNKSQNAWSGEQIKAICLPIKVDRLGNIIKIEQ